MILHEGVAEEEFNFFTIPVKFLFCHTLFFFYSVFMLSTGFSVATRHD